MHSLCYLSLPFPPFRCQCEYKSIAFSIFEKCGAHQQVELALESDSQKGFTSNSDVSSKVTRLVTLTTWEKGDFLLEEHGGLVYFMSTSLGIGLFLALILVVAASTNG